jgi:NAD(P)-dependent dehydrogenase (short-subunit alcohol dehydrogenase family)
MQNKYDLTGKTALVTGGGQGIGKSIALALAEAGANVIINYRSNALLAEETAELAGQFGRKVWLWPYDLVQEKVRENYLAFVAEHQCPADILVTNASYQIRKPWDQVTKEDFGDQMNVNVRSSLFLIQAVVPYMKEKRWGRIVNIGSVQQKRPHQEMCIYAASKMALVNLVSNLAPQLAPWGITINTLSPGAIGTGRNEAVLANPEYRNLTESKIPLGYIGTPEDCAQLALLLCSESGRYITGADYYVDGGMGLLF